MKNYFRSWKRKRNSLEIKINGHAIGISDESNTGVARSETQHLKAEIKSRQVSGGVGLGDSLSDIVERIIKNIGLCEFGVAVPSKINYFVFIPGLFNCAFSTPSYVVSTVVLISEQWIGNTAKASHHGII
jgi:hypothetical protein